MFLIAILFINLINNFCLKKIILEISLLTILLLKRKILYQILLMIYPRFNQIYS